VQQLFENDIFMQVKAISVTGSPRLSSINGH